MPDADFGEITEYSGKQFRRLLMNSPDHQTRDPWISQDPSLIVNTRITGLVIRGSAKIRLLVKPATADQRTSDPWISLLVKTRIT